MPHCKIDTVNAVFYFLKSLTTTIVETERGKEKMLGINIRMH